MSSICLRSPECDHNFNKIKTNFVKKIKEEWDKKCDNNSIDCGSAQERAKVNTCCGSYELMDGLKELIKTVKKCNQKDIKEYITLIDKSVKGLENKACLQYRYHSDICVKLRIQTTNSTIITNTNEIISTSEPETESIVLELTFAPPNSF